MELQKLENHILIGEDLSDVSELPFKQMHGLIVKKMQYKLVNNNNKAVMHQDIVFKQGKKATKTISERLLVLYPRELCWFHDRREYEQGLTPLGVIQI